MNKECWKRVTLWFALFVSVAFNYMLFQDNENLMQRDKLLNAGQVEDVIGYDYCGEG